MSNPRSTVAAVLLLAVFTLCACDPRPGTPPSTPTPKTSASLTS